MKLLLISLIGLTIFCPNLSFAKDDNSSRDAFVRDIIISLIENKASHVDTNQHVEVAYAAWQRYQDLVNQESNKIIPKDLDKSIEIAEE